MGDADKVANVRIRGPGELVDIVCRILVADARRSKGVGSDVAVALGLQTAVCESCQGAAKTVTRHSDLVGRVRGQFAVKDGLDGSLNGLVCSDEPGVHLAA